MLRDGKAPKADQITAVVLKASLDKTSKELKNTFEHIKQEEN